MHREYLIDWKLYACGANGQIYSYHYKKYLDGYTNKFGYVTVKLRCIDGKRRPFQWHRVIYTFFYGTIPEGMQVNHIDENKQNNALSNLNLMTPKENTNWGSGIERSAAKRSVILKGRSLSEEHKAKISATLKGRIISEETIMKLRNHPSESKPVVAIDDDGNIVYEFIW